MSFILKNIQKTQKTLGTKFYEKSDFMDFFMTKLNNESDAGNCESSDFICYFSM